MDRDFHLFTRLDELGLAVSTIKDMPGFWEPFSSAVVAVEPNGCPIFYRCIKRYKIAQDAMEGHTEIAEDVKTNSENYLI